MTTVSPRMSVSDRYDEDIDFDRPPYANPLFIIDALREEIGEEAWPTHPQNPLWGTELYTSPYMTDVELGMRVAARQRRDQETGVEVAAEEEEDTNTRERHDVGQEEELYLLYRWNDAGLAVDPQPFVMHQVAMTQEPELRYYVAPGEPYDWDSSSASDIDDPKMTGSDIDKAMLKRLYAGTACEEAILFMQMRQQAVLEMED